MALVVLERPSCWICYIIVYYSVYTYSELSYQENITTMIWSLAVYAYISILQYVPPV